MSQQTEDPFLKPTPRIYTTYHLWNRWSLDMNSDGDQILAVDDSTEVMLYTGLRRMHRNKHIVSALFKHENGTEQVILLDPSLEEDGGIEIPTED